jgi:gas vesicle protein
VKEVLTGAAAGAAVGAVQGAAESGTKAAGIVQETENRVESTKEEGGSTQ